MGAIMPEAPDRGGVLGQHHRAAATASPTSRRTGGTRICTTTPTRGRPTRPTRASAGGSASSRWDPIAWRLPMPPKVGDQMDDGQKWAVSAARTALTDAGWPAWKVDPERVAVVIGNAIGGEKHYATNLRIQLPEFTRELARSAAFAGLPAEHPRAIIAETARSFLSQFPEITEDTMPGELANILAGRIANLFNFRGPSFTTDAACASGLAAVSAAAAGARRRPVRRRGRRRCGPQHERRRIREVLQDRSALRDRDASVRRRRGRLRHGRGRGAVRAEAARRRRA